MELKTKADYSALNRWERVLIGFRNLGRTGLTVQAICAITERAQQRTLDSMLKNPYAYVQYCSTVNAPVWGMRINQWLSSPNLQSRVGCQLIENSAGQKIAQLPYERMAILLAEKYPYPEWLTVEKMEGLKEINRVEPKMVAWLKAVADGVFLPHDFQSFATFKP